MKRLLSLALVAALAGCGGLQNADDFRNASPSRQGIDIKVPASGQALESSDVGQAQWAVLGETAGLYKLTRAVTVTVNAWTAAWLVLCEQIVKNPPTTSTDTQAVWGPGGEPLDPKVYKFTVTKVANGYDYVFEAKDKTKGDDAFVKLITGHHEPGAAKNAGAGKFKIDFDAAQALPDADPKTVGTGEFTYSRNEKMDVTVAVAFRQVWDNDHPGQKIDLDYAFGQISGGDGSFDFKATNAKAEHWAVRSRWHQDGSGRSDVKANNADNSVLGTVSECWGPTFLETYYAESWNAAGALGQESDCKFAAAEYSTL